jgi:hypothetical protein
MTHSSLANFVPLSQGEKVDVSAHYSLLLTHFVPLRQGRRGAERRRGWIVFRFDFSPLLFPSASDLWFGRRPSVHLSVKRNET